MADDATQAVYEEAQRMAGKVPGILEALVDRLGAHAGASAVFGEPVKRNGRTVIPVAQSMIGTGAGGGGAANEQEGSGLAAAGGAMTKPLGYVEITDHGAAFVPFQQPWQDARLVLAYSLLALVAARMVVRLIRG